MTNPTPEEAVLSNKAACMFYWDYDTQWGADRSRSSGGLKNWGYLEFENTERLLDLHAQYEIPACFAIVGAAALSGQRPYHDPAQIRRIHAAGHEVASHGFRHEWIPGLSRPELAQALRLSKDALEQCIGDPVVSFVPPFNQPFDYLQKGSVSLSERREASKARIDLYTLCAMLGECGYRFSRVSYRTFFERVIGRLVDTQHVKHQMRPENIAGITCVRLNTPGGFDMASLAMLDQCVRKGGLTIVYAHPHSLHVGNSQDEKWLIPFLEKVNRFRKQGRLQILLPGDVLND